MNQISYLLLRLAIGTSMFGHGLVRLPKLAGFSKWMLHSFEQSVLPKSLVMPFSFALPVLEFAIGVLLIVGLFTKQALVVGAILMVFLIFGSSMIENWEAIPSQLLHILFFALLLHFLSANNWALDKQFNRRP